LVLAFEINWVLEYRLPSFCNLGIIELFVCWNLSVELPSLL